MEGRARGRHRRADFAAHGCGGWGYQAGDLRPFWDAKWLADRALSGFRPAPDSGDRRCDRGQRSDLGGDCEGHRLVLCRMRPVPGTRDSRRVGGTGRVARAGNRQVGLSIGLHREVPKVIRAFYRPQGHLAGRFLGHARGGRCLVQCRHDRRDHDRTGAGGTLRYHHRDDRKKPSLIAALSRTGAG